MLYKETNPAGTIMINEAIIAQIVEQTVAPYIGKVWISNRKGQVSNFITKIGVKLVLDYIEVSMEEEKICVKLYIVIRFGLSIKKITEALIQELKANIESNTGFKAGKITIVVSGVLSKQIARRNIEVRG